MGFYDMFLITCKPTKHKGKVGYKYFVKYKNPKFNIQMNKLLEVKDVTPSPSLKLQRGSVESQRDRSLRMLIILPFLLL